MIDLEEIRIYARMGIALAKLGVIGKEEMEAITGMHQWLVESSFGG